MCIFCAIQSGEYAAAVVQSTLMASPVMAVGIMKLKNKRRIKKKMSNRGKVRK